jgi:stage V sporulation protein R
MEYEQLSKSYEYGLSKIYEMVINNDPCYAYLLHSNHFVDQKLVMAHVYGHCDFFKNNLFFAHTSRKMMDEMANHKTRIQRYIDRYGIDNVENFIDACLSIDTLIDYHAPAIMRNRPREVLLNEHGDEITPSVQKLPTSQPYMDKFVNPPEFIAAEQEKIRENMLRSRKFPENPERDVMGFLVQCAPLERWERDVLDMVREEAYYFAPQAQTKILNEGWASFWHSKIMTTRALKDDELIDYADHHSGTMAMGPNKLNPYKVGIELFRDIEDRWNRGRFGKEFDECSNMVEKAKWDRQLGLGRDKIFDVRKLYNDVTFIDEYLTPEFCKQHKLFVYAYNLTTDQYEVADRTFGKIKQQLLQQLTNFGHPIISVVDANFANRGELLLDHQFEGVEIQMDRAREVLKNIYRIWKRPVNIRTVLSSTPKIISFDGTEHKEFRP